MKYLSKISLTSLSLLALSTTQTFADTGGSSALCPKTPPFDTLCKFTADSNGVSKLIGTAISLAFLVAVIIALFFLIWGGIKWILSGGDKGGVEAARNTIIAAVIGLVVTFAAYLILNFVLQLFGISLSQITIPTFTN